MAFDITLNPPFITLTAAESDRGIAPVPPSNFRFGSIYNININTSNFSVGNKVYFDPSKAELVTENDTTYFIIDEKDIKFRENPVP